MWANVYFDNIKKVISTPKKTKSTNSSADNI